MSLTVYQFAFAQNVSKLIAHAKEIGIDISLGEAYRTQDQQFLYYYGKKINAEGNNLTIVEGKKRSWTTRSKHKKRLAIDLNFFIDGKLTYSHPKITELGQYWESLNELNRWGGNFKNTKDTPHFEMKA